MPAPWQAVTHIEHTTGPKGGSVWFLTLACGHYKAVRQPVFRVEKVDRYARGNQAPKRCRCLLCPPSA